MEQQLSSNQTNPADPTLVDTQGFQKKQNKSGKKILVILILIAIISAAAYYFFFLNKNNAEPFPEENAEVMENEEVIEVEIDKELDTDQDGLPDYLEKIIGTDENNSDTDGDSYSDFDEIKNGYNPLNEEKYMEEEWGVVKEMIRGENEGLFGEMFDISDKNSPVLANEDFSSPEATFEVYVLALEAKDMDLYSKTLDKGSLEKMNEIAASSDKTIEDSLNNIQVDIWKKADYRISEQEDNYTIMVPESRDQQVNTPDGVLPTSLLVMPDLYFRQEDNLWKIDFVTTMSDLTARMVARARAAREETDINLPEDEIILKQLAEDWKKSIE